MIQFRVLGTLELRKPDGDEIRSVLSQPKRTALLAYLSAAPPRGFQRRDRLISVFWPDLEGARNALSRSLYHLRRSLGEEALLTRGDDDVGLNPEVVWSDVAAFEAAAVAGEHARALELYRGDLLEGFRLEGASEFEQWLDAERIRLRYKAANAALALAVESELAGDLPAAIGWRQRGLELSPYDEVALRCLLTLLDHAGDRAGAVAAYQAFRQRLWDELEVEPAPETEALLQSIRERRGTVPGADTGAAAATTILDGSNDSAAGRRERMGAGSTEPATVLQDSKRWTQRSGRRRRLVEAAAIAALVAGGAGFLTERMTWRRDSSVWTSGSGTGVGTRIQSIAVLPFVNLSGDSENLYFSDGISEEILNALARVEGLRVTARSSAFRFREARLDMRDVGRRLGVAAVLEGSVRRAGSRVRVSAQLVSTANGFQVWSGTYDRDLRDILAVQEEISLAIVEALRVELVRAATGAHSRNPMDPEAYDLVLRGRYAWNKRSPEEYLRAERFFQHAIHRDPTFAAAYAGLADVYSGLADFGSRAERVEMARAAARRALELDPDLAAAHRTSGSIALLYDWNLPVAERKLLRALELDPSASATRVTFGLFLLASGRVDDGIEQMRTAVELDPLTLRYRAFLGQSCIWVRRYDAAIVALRAAIDMDSTFYIWQQALSLAYQFNGQPVEARAALEAARRRAGAEIPLRYLGPFAYAYAATGQEHAARDVLARLEQNALDLDLPPIEAAFAYAALGERDAAFRWLDAALGDRHRELIFLETHPGADPLRSDPRLSELLRRVAQRSGTGS